MWKRSLVLMAGATGLALATAACGSAGRVVSRPSATAATVLAAYRTTTSAKTARVTLQVSGNIKRVGETQQLTSTGQGIQDLSHNLGQFTLSIPGSNQPLQERLVDGDLYLNLPPQVAARAAGNKAWAKIDLNALAEQKAGTNLVGLEAAGSSSPTDILGSLEGVSNNVTNRGPTTLNGAPTQHYSADVDLNRAASRIGAQAGPRAASFFRQLTSQLHTPIMPIDLWVDQQGRVRQLRYTSPIQTGAVASGGAGASGDFTLTLGLSDFGTPVQVTAPPADQVADVTQQVGQALPTG